MDFGRPAALPFKLGDIVCLKGYGIKMTVVALGQSSAECYWFGIAPETNPVLNRASFPFEALALAERTP